MDPRPRRRFIWKLPLNDRDAADLRDINRRLDRLRAIARVLVRLRHSILQRARLAYRLKQGWRPLPATRLPSPSQQPQEKDHG